MKFKPDGAVSLAWVAIAVMLVSCVTNPREPLAVVPRVDLPRFMGDWYVIANIPTWIERGAHNAVESYRLEPDGTIATTFTFRADAFDGPIRRHEPTGYVLDSSSNAVWGMRFIWPFKADYRIAYLNGDYTQTVIARENRDYAWIMARTPTIPDRDYLDMLALLDRAGYDTRKIQKVPQQW